MGGNDPATWGLGPGRVACGRDATPWMAAVVRGGLEGAWSQLRGGVARHPEVLEAGLGPPRDGWLRESAPGSNVKRIDLTPFPLRLSARRMGTSRALGGPATKAVADATRTPERLATFVGPGRCGSPVGLSGARKNAPGSESSGRGVLFNRDLVFYEYGATSGDSDFPPFHLCHPCHR